MSFQIISCGMNAPTKQRCIDSVRGLSGPSYTHHYIEASDQPEPKNALENRFDIITGLDPTDIVLELDGDDWLFTPRALEKVAEMYEDPNTWVTYGSYVNSDGKPGHCAPYAAGEPYRMTAWRASHLKTFKAGLFQKIKKDDLMGPRGGFSPYVHDLYTMFPMLEMAGRDRVRFCPEILYVYNRGNSFEWNNTLEAERAYEKECEIFVRGRPPYERLESL